MSELYQSLSRAKWDCKYHIVFDPKLRRKVIFGQAELSFGTDAECFSDGLLGEPPVAKSCMATVRLIRAAGYFCCPDFS